MGHDLPVSPLAPASFPDMPEIAGVTLATAEANIRYAGRDDVLLMVLGEGTQTACVTTRSLTAAAPIEWCRSIAPNGTVRAVVVNSGNANAFTGKAGTESVRSTVAVASECVGCEAEAVYIASTGVIGEKLPDEKIGKVLPDLVKSAKADGWVDAAHAIMTTDTYPKYATRTSQIDGKKVTINAIAKGSGMIAPDMATMLGFVATDAHISASVLKTMLTRTNQKTFNSITVDGDTSTNDMVLLLATGKAAHELIDDPSDERLRSFKEAFSSLMEDMARQIVRDGEGATKEVEVRVTGAEDDGAARRIALTIGNSPLVKTAAAGEDPNWGRIVAAVGKSGEWADRDRLMIEIGKEVAAKDGELNPGYVEANAAKHMKQQHIVLHVDVGVGRGEATIWTCDFTAQYIAINADYRS